jgi:hypothetical protein
VGVDCLASNWGVRETVTGKTAWAESDVRGGPGAGHQLSSGRQAENQRILFAAARSILLVFLQRTDLDIDIASARFACPKGHLVGYVDRLPAS